MKIARKYRARNNNGREFFFFMYPSPSLYYLPVEEQNVFFRTKRTFRVKSERKNVESNRNDQEML